MIITDKMNEMINLSYCRPKKREALQEQYNGYFTVKNDLKALVVSNAVILPQRIDNKISHGIGGVIDNNGSFIQLSGLNNQFGGLYDFDNNIQIVSETVCYCGYLIDHWGHFLLDVVSRLWYALEHDVKVDSYVFLVEENSSRKPTGNYFEFFRLLGIDKKIRIVNTPTRFTKVIIPEISFAKGKYYSDKYNQIFDQVIKSAINNNSGIDWPDKVYLSRNHFRGKTVESGLDFIDHFFTKNGFEVVYPEEVSLSKMILLLQNADVCAAESGTLTHNFLFAQQGKAVIIVERQVTINVYQCNVDIVRGLEATYVDANYEIYTTSSSYGPYFLGYTRMFQLFVKEQNMLAPDTYYTSESYTKKCLRQYLKWCDKEYGYTRQHSAWQYYLRHLIFEAYEEALEKFRPYLLKQKPLFWYNYFQWRFIKHAIRRLLVK